VEACPYSARFISPAINKADKCDFCSTRLERGQMPICVQTCTGHAKFFGDLEDSSSGVFKMVYEQSARRLETSEVAIGPNVYYRGKKEWVDLILATYPLHRPHMPEAGTVWEKVVKPLVLAAVGVTFLGQAVAFFRQLRKGESLFEDEGEE
jgi:hypothetical protein